MPSDVEGVGVADDGDDQVVVEGDGDADVNLLAQDDAPVIGPRGVEVGILFEPLDGGFDDEGLEGDAVALAALELVLVGVEPAGDVGHVDLEDRPGVGRGVLAAHHVLGDGAARGRGRDDIRRRLTAGGADGARRGRRALAEAG